MRDSTLSSVLLPAPFGPTMPMTSPTPTSKETSAAPRICVALSPRPARCWKRRHGPVTQLVSDSPSVASPIGASADRVALAEPRDDDGVR